MVVKHLLVAAKKVVDAVRVVSAFVGNDYLVLKEGSLVNKHHA